MINLKERWSSLVMGGRSLPLRGPGKGNSCVEGRWITTDREMREDSEGWTTVSGKRRKRRDAILKYAREQYEREKECSEEKQSDPGKEEEGRD
jgi:hypothetical protein